MDLNHTVILRTIGVLLVAIGIAMFPAMIVALIYNEKTPLAAFFATSVPMIIAGVIMIKTFQPSLGRIKARDGFLIASVCLILTSVIGAVPFVLSGEIPNLIDAFFETASGFSTTGASVLTDIETLSRSMLFWRSFTEWLGGLGILIFAIALLPALGFGGNIIIPDTAKSICFLYTGFTILEMLLLCTAGLSLYDALVHSFATLSTGGFSVYNASAAHFNSAYVGAIMVVFMLIAGTSFNLHYRVIKRGFKEFTRDTEFKFYMSVVFVSALLIGFNLYFAGTYRSVTETIHFSVFQTISTITTTGYAAVDYDLWPTFSKMVLFLLMFVGGCSVSTGGGIKAIRMLIVLKLIERGIAIRLHPSAIVSVKLRGRPVPSDVVSAVAGTVFLYIVLFFISTILVSLNNFDMMTSISAVAACMGNIGPGFELVGPAMNYSIFAAPIKVLLAFLMIIGRLELFTLLMLFTPKFWNPSR